MNRIALGICVVAASLFVGVSTSSASYVACDVSTSSASVVAASPFLDVSTSSASYMTHDGIGQHQSVVLHAKGLMADGKTVSAGQLRIGYEGEKHLGYCVDLDQWARSCDVDALSVKSLNNGDKVAFLYDAYASHVDSNLKAAALQVAIWELVYEESCNKFDAGKGYLYITKNEDAIKAANILLASMPNVYGGPYTPVVLHSDKYQDVLIPEPATLALLGLGGLGMLIRKRRNR